MHPKPVSQDPTTKPSGRLQDRVALITGGDSGIGRAVAISFAKEGAKVVIGYLNEEVDARETARLVEEVGGSCLAIPGDVGDSEVCKQLVERVWAEYSTIDILVNNAAEQHPQEDITLISDEQLERTFRTNIFSMFYLCRYALPAMKPGSAVVNTASVTAYAGSPQLLDYSATKGAIVAFTRSLSQAVVSRGIRVNAVAPGPIWTPLIPSTLPVQKVQNFGKDVPMGRPGQPEEVAPCYVFLASAESSYITGQVLHVNGGEIING